MLGSLAATKHYSKETRKINEYFKLFTWEASLPGALWTLWGLGYVCCTGCTGTRGKGARLIIKLFFAIIII